jgi:hypothetical protein
MTRAWLLVLLVTGGCADEAGQYHSKPCTPGEQVACACAGGAQGTQICRAGGDSFGACACGEADLGGADLVSADLVTGDLAPATTSITLTTSWYTGALGNVSLVAVKDEAGAKWAPVSATSTGKYTFDVKGAYYSVVAVCGALSGAKASVRVFHRTIATNALSFLLSDNCAAPPGDPPWRTVGGSVANYGGQSDVAFGGYGATGVYPVAFLSTSYPSSNSYQAIYVDDGSWDLGFTLPTSSNAGSPVGKILFLRNNAIAGNKTINLDFNNAVTTPAGTFTLTGGSASEPASFAVGYQTRSNATTIPLGRGGSVAAASGTVSYGAVPAAQQAAGDNYLVTVASSNASGGRSLELYRKAVPSAIALPDHVGAYTATLMAGGAYPRLNATWPAYANATSYLVQVVQSSGATNLVWVTDYDVSYMTAAGIASPSETTPDFSSLPGWLAAWGLQSMTTAVMVRGTARTEVADGYELRSAYRYVTIP